MACLRSTRGPFRPYKNHKLVTQGLTDSRARRAIVALDLLEADESVIVDESDERAVEMIIDHLVLGGELGSGRDGNLGSDRTTGLEP